ncbi:MAG: FtsH protease activity modulator HflK [Roseinatronobacter sp.]|jgi:membrane protease subunit HflK|uniref:Protein HflK n=1 Tax=Roseinatronobacter monicus TaxID=393481 RepID=A0A543KEI1_9RHOB|nr:FtsH protease activity modulator HflK [Roseinatronobacter monicus]TQM93496.1 protease FtsH subunit HflK [Roseinatronobacter monicus]TVP98228.1 MAG: FtsH protease activity modulator HflK [Roseinatronobacter sp.]
MSGNNGGPWGGGGNRGGGNRGSGGGGRGGDGQPPMPEIDEIVKKGQEQLRVLMGGGGGGGKGGKGLGGPGFSKRGVLIGLAALVVMWTFASFYTVRPEERSVELLFGQYYKAGQPGLNFAPWPVVSHEIVQVTTERVTEVGTGRSALDTGLMLTRDEAVVDIEFQVVWNVTDPARFLFNLADPRETVRAASESAMRDIIARSELSPILNRDRGSIAADLRAAVQGLLDSYESGIAVIRVNFDKADPPEGVINAFRDVQTARQERDRLEREADAYANRVLAQARGQAAQLQEEAEAYRAEVVNNAQGEAARFVSVYSEYVNAPEVTRKRMYLETMERVLGDMSLTILDNVTGSEAGGSGVLPYLPLDSLSRTRSAN